MAVEFPQNPQEGDQFSSGNYVYVFQDGKWVSAGLSATVDAIVGATGPAIDISSLPPLP